MTCNIPYIDNANKNGVAIPSNKVTELRDLHLNIAKQIKQATFDNAGVDEPLFNYRKGYLVLGIQGTARYTAQEKFIADINTLIDSTYNPNTPLFEATTLPLYITNGVVDEGAGLTSTANILALNVFNTLTSDEKINYFGGATIDIGNIDLKTLVAMNEDEVRSMFDLSNDWSLEGGEHTDFFLKHAKKFREALSIYLGSINKSSVGLPSTSIKLNKLYELNEALAVDDGVLAATSVHNYVAESMKHIANIVPMLSIEYAETNENNIYFLLHELDNNTALSEDERNDNIRKISKILNDSVQYLHLFSGMEEFHTELKKQGFKPNELNRIDTRNPKFINALSLAVKNHITEGDYRELLSTLKDDKFTVGGFKEAIRRMLPSANESLTTSESNTILDNVQRVFDGYSTKDDIDSFLAESMEMVNGIKSDIKKIHEEILVRKIYPKIQEKQANRPDEFKLTLEDFRNQISTADIDEGFGKTYFDAAIKSNDALTANAANIVADAYYAAHIRNIQDSITLSGYADQADIDRLTKIERENYYEGMSHDVYEHMVDDKNNMIEADQEWLDERKPTIEIDVLGVKKVFKAKDGKSAFLTEKNTIKYAASKKAFDDEKRRIVDDLYKNIVVVGENNKLTFNWKYLEDEINRNWLKADGTQNLYYKEIYIRFYKGYQEHVKRKDFVNDHSKIKPALSNAMYSVFEKENYEALTQANLTVLYNNIGINNINARRNSIPNGISSIANQHRLLPNNIDVENEIYREKLLEAHENLIHKYDNENVYIYMNKGGTYQWVNISVKNALKPNTIGERLSFFAINQKLKVLKKSKYNIEQGGWGEESRIKWQALHNDAPKSNYYKKLFEMYTSANNNVKGGALKHGIHAQIEQVEQFDGIAGTTTSTIKNFGKWLYRVFTAQGVRSWFKKIEGNDEDSERTSPTRQYINGDTLRDVPFAHTTYIDESKREKDLFRSVLAYKNAGNNYEETSKIEPVMQVLRRVITGDMKLSLDARKVLKRDGAGKRLTGAFGAKLKDNMPNLNSKLLRFIDDSIYGESTIAGTGKLNLGKYEMDLNKFGSDISGNISLINLAWNVSAMFANVGVGNINNLIQASSGQYSTSEDFLKAKLEYNKYFVTGGFMRDMVESNPAKKTTLGQLNIFFDSIQGEYSSDILETSRKGTVDKAFNRLTMWTQGGAEHQIQSQLLIQLMRGYKLPSGKSLWESVVEQPNKFVSFTDEVTPEVIKDFRNRLHGVNKNLHGQYAKLDKSMLSRHWLGKLVMVYKKFIYSSWRNRFTGEGYDWEIGDSTQGYVNQYFNKLGRYWKDDSVNKWMYMARFAEEVVGKTHLGALDSLTGRNLSKIGAVNEYLYGGLSNEEVIATKKTTTEIAWFLMMGILSVLAHGMTDDDDDDDFKSKIFQSLEATTSRIQGDIGMFLPFFNSYGLTNSGTAVSFDKTWQMVKNPLAQMRSADNVGKLFGQFISDTFSVISGDGFEQYERNGIGYNKGDYKIVRDAKKTFPYLSAYYHVMQAMNPKEQLQYNNLMRQRSKTKVKKDKEK
jgi:hypothetical protein